MSKQFPQTNDNSSPTKRARYDFTGLLRLACFGGGAYIALRGYRNGNHAALVVGLFFFAVGTLWAAVSGVRKHFIRQPQNWRELLSIFTGVGYGLFWGTLGITSLSLCVGESLRPGFLRRSVESLSIDALILIFAVAPLSLGTLIIAGSLSEKREFDGFASFKIIEGLCLILTGAFLLLIYIIAHR